MTTIKLLLATYADEEFEMLNFSIIVWCMELQFGVLFSQVSIYLF